MACQRCSVCNIGWPLGTHECGQCGDPTWYSVNGHVTRATGAMKPKPAPVRPGAIECDRCHWEVTGYTRTELEREHNWAWHGGEFVMCGECEQEFANRRLERALLKGAQAA